MSLVFKPCQFVSIKDIMNLCNCSYSTAFRLRKDISHEYFIKPKMVTYGLLMKYLGMPL